MRRALPLLVAVQAALLPLGLGAQVLAEPVLRGQVLLGDSLLRSGVVVLHRVGADTQGEVDSTQVSGEGAFSFRLPAVPDPERSEVYFASVHHAGVLYFGKAVTLAVQLDSLYQIQAYDTLLAPPEGAGITVQARNLFLEESQGGRWQVTDLFQLRNDEPRTVVARDGGVVWRHPLAEGATDATMGEGDFAGGGGETVEGDLVVTGPLPPGERLFVVRYTLPDPFLNLPLTHPTEILELMVREPAPVLEAPELEDAPPVQWDEGQTFRRLAAVNLAPGVIRVVEGSRRRPPPVQWLAVLLALVLAGVGTWAVQRGSFAPARPQAAPLPTDRQGLILEIARLDEEFASRPNPTAEERGAYEARRGALLRRLIQLG